MAEQDGRARDDAAEVARRNVAGMRALLAQQAQQQRGRAAEQPLEDDPNVASHEDALAQEPSGGNGSTGGIRNMGGGRP